MFVEFVQLLRQTHCSGHQLRTLQVLKWQKRFSLTIELVVQHQSVERGVVGEDGLGVDQEIVDLVGILITEAVLVDQVDVAEAVDVLRLHVDPEVRAELLVVPDLWLVVIDQGGYPDRHGLRQLPGVDPPQADVGLHVEEVDRLRLRDPLLPRCPFSFPIGGCGELGFLSKVIFFSVPLNGVRMIS